jgi:hypothetical protein
MMARLVGAAAPVIAAGSALAVVGGLLFVRLRETLRRGRVEQRRRLSRADESGTAPSGPYSPVVASQPEDRWRP